jgi:hypothetical protein
MLKFEELKPTTMTTVITLDGTINLKETFTFLPITKVELPNRTKPLKKFKIPHHKTPGSILSMRYSGYTRGIVRSTSKKWFKNSITIDMSVKDKNLSLKVSNGKIQMCGALSEEQSLEGANLLIENIKEVQSSINYIKKNQEKYDKIIEFIDNNFRGNMIDLDDSNTTETDDDEIRYSLSIPDDLKAMISIDKQISHFLISFVNEFICFNDFINICKWINDIESLSSENLSINSIKKVMVNYNYSLGFKIDRFNLADKISHLNGFTSRYVNTAEYNVTITLPIDKNNDKKKQKTKYHTFMVYQSGLVTQSGPGDKQMEDAYNLFSQTIQSIKNDIIAIN